MEQGVKVPLFISSRSYRACGIEDSGSQENNRPEPSFNATAGYTKYDDTVIRAATIFFETTPERLQDLHHVLKRSRVLIHEYNDDQSSLPNWQVAMTGHQAARVNKKKSNCNEISLSLMEFAFNRYGALTNDMNKTGLYRSCIGSKGKKLFDAFKRKESYNVIIKNEMIQTNLAQLRWTMFACKYGLFDFIRDNLVRIKGIFDSSKASARCAKKRIRDRDPGSLTRKGRRRREKTACVGAANVFL